jgi:hypothetical protein
MLYHIYFCNDCSLKCEISVKGDAWCGCGAQMEKIGEMNE